jgi:hypothetical protein
LKDATVKGLLVYYVSAAFDQRTLEYGGTNKVLADKSINIAPEMFALDNMPVTPTAAALLPAAEPNGTTILSKIGVNDRIR